MKPNPEVIELDYEELQSKLDQIEAVTSPEMVQPFRQLLNWYTVLLGSLRDKTISIQRLQRMLFGASTERTSNVLPTSSSDQPADPEPVADQGVVGVIPLRTLGIHPDPTAGNEIGDLGQKGHKDLFCQVNQEDLSFFIPDQFTI
mgnify:CR=1 FL=1